MLKEIIPYEESFVSNNCEIIHTKISIEYIENKLNNILDKHDSICKYFIDINDNTYWVSFNVGIDQFEAMFKTMFSIKIYKDVTNNTILLISKEITENHNWNDIYSDLINKLKK